MNGPELLKQRIKATATEGFVIAACVAVMGLGMTALTAAPPEGVETGQRAFFGLMAAGGLVAAAMIAADARTQLPPEGTRLYKDLAGDSSEVAWAYQTVGKSNSVEIHFTDGGQTKVSARGTDAQLLLAWIHSRAPRALIGFGEQQKAAYAALRAERRNST